MRIIITEEQQNMLMNDNEEKYDKRILTYLFRHFPVDTRTLNFTPEIKIRNIYIGDKSRNLDSNSKKYLVNSIYNIISEDIPITDENITRKTIKYFIDLVRSHY